MKKIYIYSILLLSCSNSIYCPSKDNLFQPDTTIVDYNLNNGFDGYNARRPVPTERHNQENIFQRNAVIVRNFWSSLTTNMKIFASVCLGLTVVSIILMIISLSIFQNTAHQQTVLPCLDVAIRPLDSCNINYAVKTFFNLPGISYNISGSGSSSGSGSDAISKFLNFSKEYAPRLMSLEGLCSAALIFTCMQDHTEYTSLAKEIKEQLIIGDSFWVNATNLMCRMQNEKNCGWILKAMCNNQGVEPKPYQGMQGDPGYNKAMFYEDLNSLAVTCGGKGGLGGSGVAQLHGGDGGIGGDAGLFGSGGDGGVGGNSTDTIQGGQGGVGGAANGALYGIKGGDAYINAMDIVVDGINAGDGGICYSGPFGGLAGEVDNSFNVTKTGAGGNCGELLINGIQYPLHIKGAMPSRGGSGSSQGRKGGDGGNYIDAKKAIGVFGTFFNSYPGDGSDATAIDGCKGQSLIEGDSVAIYLLNMNNVQGIKQSQSTSNSCSKLQPLIYNVSQLITSTITDIQKPSIPIFQNGNSIVGSNITNVAGLILSLFDNIVNTTLSNLTNTGNDRMIQAQNIQGSIIQNITFNLPIMYNVSSIIGSNLSNLGINGIHNIQTIQYAQLNNVSNAFNNINTISGNFSNILGANGYFAFQNGNALTNANIKDTQGRIADTFKIYDGLTMYSVTTNKNLLLNRVDNIENSQIHDIFQSDASIFDTVAIIRNSQICNMKSQTYASLLSINLIDSAIMNNVLNAFNNINTISGNFSNILGANGYFAFQNGNALTNANIKDTQGRIADTFKIYDGLTMYSVTTNKNLLLNRVDNIENSQIHDIFQSDASIFDTVATIRNSQICNMKSQTYASLLSINLIDSAIMNNVLNAFNNINTISGNFSNILGANGYFAFQNGNALTNANIKDIFWSIANSFNTYDGLTMYNVTAQNTWLLNRVASIENSQIYDIFQSDKSTFDAVNTIRNSQFYNLESKIMPALQNIDSIDSSAIHNGAGLISNVKVISNSKIMDTQLDNSARTEAYIKDGNQILYSTFYDLRGATCILSTFNVISSTIIHNIESSDYFDRQPPALICNVANMINVIINDVKGCIYTGEGGTDHFVNPAIQSVSYIYNADISKIRPGHVILEGAYFEKAGGKAIADYNSIGNKDGPRISLYCIVGGNTKDSPEEQIRWSGGTGLDGNWGDLTTDMKNIVGNPNYGTPRPCDRAINE